MASSRVSTRYRRRQPERRLLYRTVQTHLATWPALHDDGAGETAPAVAEREFRRYLDCGILAHGFARARCASGRPRHPAFACAPVGALRAQALALVTGNAIRQFSAPHCTFS